MESKQTRDFIARLESYYKDREDVELFDNIKMINFDIVKELCDTINSSNIGIKAKLKTNNSYKSMFNGTFKFSCTKCGSKDYKHNTHFRTCNNCGYIEDMLLKLVPNDPRKSDSNINKPGIEGETFTIKLNENWFPYTKVSIEGVEDFFMIDYKVLPKGIDFDIDKWIKTMKEQPIQIVKSEDITLKGFISKFVEPNSLIRLWYKTLGGHEAIFPDLDVVEMDWRIRKSEGAYSGLENSHVVGVTDILVKGNYTEAINIVIHKNN